MFLVEAAQAGIFQIRGVAGRRNQRRAGRGLPEHPVPVRARNRVRRGQPRRLPPVLLSPINFEALYAQQMAEQSGNAH